MIIRYQLLEHHTQCYAMLLREIQETEGIMEFHFQNTREHYGVVFVDSVCQLHDSRTEWWLIQYAGDVTSR